MKLKAEEKKQNEEEAILAIVEETKKQQEQEAFFRILEEFNVVNNAQWEVKIDDFISELQ